MKNDLNNVFDEQARQMPTQAMDNFFIYSMNVEHTVHLMHYQFNTPPKIHRNRTQMDGAKRTFVGRILYVCQPRNQI